MRCLLRLLVVAAPLLAAACSTCPGCPRSAAEAGLPVRVQMHETQPVR